MDITTVFFYFKMNKDNHRKKKKTKKTNGHLNEPLFAIGVLQ